MNRTVSLLGALSIGIGGMVGGGIFAVLGEAVSMAHSATPLAFLVAGIVAVLSAYSYSKLSVYFQSSGGTIVFIDNAFRHSLFSGSINFLLWLSYLVTISLYAVAFGSYALTFFDNGSSLLLKHFFISLAIVMPGTINLINASLVSKSETLVVIIKLLLMLLIIVVGFPYVDYQRLVPSSYGSSFSIVAAGMIIFVAYEGFELIANASAEIKEPQKNLPRAFFGSVVFVIILYILIAIITVGAVDEHTLLVAKDYALAVATKPALGQFGFTLVAIAALLATFSAINATIFGNARLSYALSFDGELPKVDKDGVSNPKHNAMLTIGLSLLMANFINLNAIAIIGSASFLLIFSVVNLSAYKLQDKIGGLKLIYLSAFIVSVFALIILLMHTYSKDSFAVFIFLLFILLSISFESIYGRIYRKKHCCDHKI